MNPCISLTSYRLVQIRLGGQVDECASLGWRESVVIHILTFNLRSRHLSHGGSFLRVRKVLC